MTTRERPQGHASGAPSRVTGFDSVVAPTPTEIALRAPVDTGPAELLSHAGPAQMLALQRLAGNQAVATVVGPASSRPGCPAGPKRVSPGAMPAGPFMGGPVVKRLAVATPGGTTVQRQRAKAPVRRIQYPEGRVADAWLRANDFIRPYIERKMNKAHITVERAVTVHSHESFTRHFVRIARRSINPDTQRLFTRDEAISWVQDGRVESFQSGPTIYLQETRGAPTHVIHEAMHLFSHYAFVNLGYNTNEGTTEYFTRLITSQRFQERNPMYFRWQRQAIERLVAASSRRKLADAYFNGSLIGLRSDVEGKGEGRWTRWVRAMKAGDMNTANRQTRG